ncbi:MAG TPA: hypothetical protein VFP05_11030 [Thermomicrobiales bacterium]|nr:hypothetical protein [Thermomicrobiales bacterium]
MRRVFALVVSFLCVLLIAPAIGAQDATPMAGGTATASLLAGLGYPDLVVTSDGTTNDLPATLAAGRYHVVLHNTNATEAIDLDFFLPPEGTSADETITAFNDSISSEVPPDIFYQLTLAGGLTALPNGTAEGIIDLTPGDWVAGIQTENENGSNVGGAQAISITGEMPALTDPTVAVTATLSDLKIDLPDSVPTGPQIWKVTNAGSMPHFIAISMSDGTLTQENVQETLGMFIGTPLPAGATPIAESALTDVASTGVLSPGQSMWIEVDLQPGQYLAACYLSGPGELPMHAAMGMFKIFDAA